MKVLLTYLAYYWASISRQMPNKKHFLSNPIGMRRRRARKQINLPNDRQWGHGWIRTPKQTPRYFLLLFFTCSHAWCSPVSLFLTSGLLISKLIGKSEWCSQNHDFELFFFACSIKKRQRQAVHHLTSVKLGISWSICRLLSPSCIRRKKKIYFISNVRGKEVLIIENNQEETEGPWFTPAQAHSFDREFKFIARPWHCQWANSKRREKEKLIVGRLEANSIDLCARSKFDKVHTRAFILFDIYTWQFPWIHVTNSSESY